MAEDNKDNTTKDLQPSVLTGPIPSDDARNVKHKRMIKYVNMLEFRCPCCGEVINASFIDFYEALHSFIAKEFWENGGKRAEQARRATAKNQVRVAKRYKFNSRPRNFSEETLEFRREQGKRIGEASAERRRKISEQAEHDIDANRQMRKHVIARANHKLEKLYTTLKPVLRQIQGGAIIRSREKILQKEIANVDELMAFISTSRLYKDKQIYKLNAVMKDGKAFGQLMFNNNYYIQTGHYVYGVAIPDSIPDLPDTLTKYANATPQDGEEDAQ